MDGKREGRDLIIYVIWLLVGLVVGIIVSALATLIILLISDSLLYEKTQWQSSSQSSGFLTRVNWLFASVVFVISFGVIAISTYFGVQSNNERDDMALSNLKSYADRQGENANSVLEGNSFASTFEIGSTKFEGNFTIKLIPQPSRVPGNRLNLCNSSVWFNVPFAVDEFIIESSGSAFKSMPSQGFISSASNENPTKQLDGHYTYSFSNYSMFSEVVANEEIIEDLNKTARDPKTTMKISLKDKQFRIESCCEIRADEERAQRKGVQILNVLFLKAQMYHGRFQKIGLIEEQKET